MASSIFLKTCSFELEVVEDSTTVNQWRSQDLVSGGAQPLSPIFFIPFPRSPSFCHFPILPSPLYPSRLLSLPIAPPSHKFSGESGDTVSSPSGSGRSPAAKQFLVHFPFCIYTVTPHQIFVVCCFNHGLILHFPGNCNG